MIEEWIRTTTLDTLLGSWEKHRTRTTSMMIAKGEISFLLPSVSSLSKHLPEVFELIDRHRKRDCRGNSWGYRIISTRRMLLYSNRTTSASHLRSNTTEKPPILHVFDCLRCFTLHGKWPSPSRVESTFQNDIATCCSFYCCVNSEIIQAFFATLNRELDQIQTIPAQVISKNAPSVLRQYSQRIRQNHPTRVVRA